MFLLSRIQWAGIALVLLIVSHGAAWTNGWFKGVASERAVWQAERAKIMAQAAAAAEVARGEGRRLAAELELARAEVRTVYVDRIRTIVRIASPARECLSPGVTASLNRAPIRETVERPGEPPRAVETPAAGGTSELAAAEWIAGAQAAHAECRSQVQRLGDWIRSVTKGPHDPHPAADRAARRLRDDSGRLLPHPGAAGRAAGRAAAAASGACGPAGEAIAHPGDRRLPVTMA